MPTIQEDDEPINDAALGEFFDFGNATAPDNLLDSQTPTWASGYNTPCLPEES